MIATAVRRPLRRLLLLLGAPLVAAGMTVAMTATPAHAITYRGTFSIRLASNQGLCAQVENNGTTNRTPVVLGACNGTAGQRWAIFQVSGVVSEILAYGGSQPLNKCLDKGSSDHVWIYGCHGGDQQMWSINANSAAPQLIESRVLDREGSCLTTKNGAVAVGSALARGACFFGPDITQVAPNWVLVPA